MSLRDELITAATGLLDDGGPEKVTLREVGRLTGVSRTAPYRHFASKSDLLATVAAGELDRLVDAVENLSATDTDPAGSLVAALRHYLRWAREAPERFRLVFGRWTEENADLRRAADRANLALVELVGRARREDAVPAVDPWRTAAAIRAFVHGLAVLEQNGHLRGQDGAPLDADDLLQAFIGVTRDGTSGSPRAS